MATKHVAQWGNSLAVRITRNEARELGWEGNTPIRASIVEGKLVLEAQAGGPLYTLEELIEGLTAEKAHADLDAGPDYPVGNEAW